MVAPLAGSVDRNNEVHQFENYDNIVAPLAGSVDRNRNIYVAKYSNTGRSPRGERG